MGQYSDQINEAFRRKNLEKLSPEVKAERELNLINEFIQGIDEKTNRILFYCPDMEFPSRSLVTIYQFSNLLNKLGYNSIVLHEEYGFKPTWLDTKFEHLQVQYLSSKKDKIKKQNKSHASFTFKANDTVIVPDGFWYIMENLAEEKTIEKIVLLMSYEGLGTMKNYYNWYHFGFKKAISVGQNLMIDHQTLFPYIKFEHIPYVIDEAKPVENKTDIKPEIGLFVRNKREAAQIINAFVNKYPMLSVWQFKVLRKLNSNNYIDQLAKSAILVVHDPMSGCVVPPLEAISVNIPVLLAKTRNVEHLQTADNIIAVDDSIFAVVDELAAFCYNWMFEPNETIYKGFKQEPLLAHKEDAVREKLDTYFESNQINIKEKFLLAKTKLEQHESANA